MKSLVLSLVLFAILAAGSANAALQFRLGGLAVYDSDLNITWLTDANANGLMNWSQANAWAAGLTVGGVSGWRLPTTLQPDTSCNNQAGGISTGPCRGSEMGHLFFNELGGLDSQLIFTTHNDNINLFQNIQYNNYWSSTEYAPDTQAAWGFYLTFGHQYAFNKINDFYGMAVRDGDVAAVPLPAAGWLLGSGLMSLISVARRKVAYMDFI